MLFQILYPKNSPPIYVNGSKVPCDTMVPLYDEKVKLKDLKSPDFKPLENARKT